MERPQRHNDRPRPSEPGPNPDRSLAYNLGAFFGEIIKAVRTPVDVPAARQPPVHVRHETRETELQTQDGRVRVRRTVVDEVERLRD